MKVFEIVIFEKKNGSERRYNENTMKHYRRTNILFRK